MHYELYVDSLFLINLCMNLYLLMLVDHSTLGTAMPWRLTAGAAAGAVCFLLPFFGGAPALVRLVLGGLAGTVGMLCITFPVRSLRMFLKLLERLLLYSFGIGGGMLFLIARLPFLREYLTSVCGVLSVGGVLFLFFRRFRCGLRTKQCLCGAALFQGGQRMTVTALIDSGNSLTEPISGKPVCVVDEDVYAGLWKEEGCGYRAIPYHSIGKKRGILQGYLLSKLTLDLDGMRLEFRDVYVAVSREQISAAENGGGGAVRMIINPRLLETGTKRGLHNMRNQGVGAWLSDQGRASWDKRKKRERKNLDNDIQSDDAGENTV